MTCCRDQERGLVQSTLRLDPDLGQPHFEEYDIIFFLDVVNIRLNMNRLSWTLLHHLHTNIIIHI